MYHILDQVFEIFNNPIKMQKLNYRMLSLSVDDIVVVDGIKYKCINVGWEIV